MGKRSRFETTVRKEKCVSVLLYEILAESRAVGIFFPKSVAVGKFLLAPIAGKRPSLYGLHTSPFSRQLLVILTKFI